MKTLSSLGDRMLTALVPKHRASACYADGCSFRHVGCGGGQCYYYYQFGGQCCINQDTGKSCWSGAYCYTGCC